MKKLIIRIDCGDKTCGDCRFLVNAGFGSGDFCELFGLGIPLGRRRPAKCRAAERKAQKGTP